MQIALCGPLLGLLSPVIRMLERPDLIPTYGTHAGYHTYPHAGDYWVASGWSNPTRKRQSISRRLETAMAKCDGMHAGAAEDAISDESGRQTNSNHPNSENDNPRVLTTDSAQF